MRTLKLSFLLTVLLSMVGANVFAINIAVENDEGVTIYYTFINNNTELAVTYRGSSYQNDADRYVGNVVIPSSVIYNGTTYNVTYIGQYAFSYCSSLTSVTIPNSVTTIGNYAFYNCGKLASLTIGTSVTSIGSYAFYKCRSLTEVSIPNSVVSIGNNAFDDCFGLIKVCISDLKAWCKIKFGSNPLTRAGHLFLNGEEIIDLVIPNSITSISDHAFDGGRFFTSVTIPNSVIDIGAYAFLNCSAVTSVTISDGVTSIGMAAFWNCSGLTSVTIPNSVTSIGNSAFEDCSLSEVVFPDNIIYIGSEAFNRNVVMWVKRGTKSLLALWQADYTPRDVESNESLICPTLTQMSATQATVTVKIRNMYEEYTFYVNNVKAQEETIVVPDMFPEETAYVNLSVYMGDKENAGTFGVNLYYRALGNTRPISPTIETSSTASSIRVKGTYIEGDAHITSQSIGVYVNSDNDLVKQADSNAASITGLVPNIPYMVKYDITVTNSEGYKRTYSCTETVRTEELILMTSQPKVVSMGNVIVSAQANLDDEETNVGFEWRRTDWPDDFASSTGAAYMYNGTMEGYIRNLNTDKLWRCRPYYLSDSGTYYYGVWMGIDPTNTSYFEPTVHTYEQVEIDGNTALVKGYAMTGSDDVTMQGFMYWKSVAGAQSADATNRAVAIPGDATTVEASGQVMTANLTGLDYNSTYHYVAFVKTTTGETFYGEERMFDTGADPTGISEVAMDKPTTSDMVRKGIYTLSGMKVADDISELYSLPYGVYIVNGKKYNLSRNSRP